VDVFGFLATHASASAAGVVCSSDFVCVGGEDEEEEEGRDGEWNGGTRGRGRRRRTRLGELRELPDFPDLFAPGRFLQALGCPFEHGVCGEARVFWDAFVILDIAITGG
jgi:hypothetical protein